MSGDGVGDHDVMRRRDAASTGYGQRIMAEVKKAANELGYSVPIGVRLRAHGREHAGARLARG